MVGFLGEARKKEVAVVQTRSDKAVNEDGSGIGEGWRQLMLLR